MVNGRRYRMDWHGRHRPALQALESRSSCVRLASKLDDDEDEFDTDQDEASRGLLSGIMARAIVRGTWNLWVGHDSNKHMSTYTFRLTLRSLRQSQALRFAIP